MTHSSQKLLLILYFLTEKAREVKDEWVVLERIVSFLPPSAPRRNIYSLINYAQKAGEVKKKKYGTSLLFKLTEKGKEKINEVFPLVDFNKKKWDRSWRVLIYDIPETKKSQREMLRRKIIELGFGKLSGSVYISPFPIEREMVNFLEKYGLTEKVLFLTTENIFSGGDKYLTEKIWKLSRLNRHYEMILKQMRDNNNERDERRFRAEFISLLVNDPFFPEELLPEPWHRDDLIKSFI